MLGGVSEAYDTLKEIEEYIEKDEAGAVALAQSITRLETEKVSKEDIDSALSTASENPVMNKVITEELGKKVEGYFGLVKQIDYPSDDYLDEWGESISIPLGIEISDSLEIKVSYYDPWIESTDYLSLNKENNFYDEAWNDSGDHFFQAKYANGALLLEEPNNFSVGFFQRVEVYNVKPIEESLIPNTIARTEDVNAINAEQNERISELREETVALWENLDSKANTNGVFPDLVSGDLAGRGESVPALFGFRASGGKSIKDGRAYIKRIKGNSVVWNQHYPTGWSSTREGITSTSVNGKISAIGTTTAENFRFEPFSANIANHKYLFTLSGASSALEGKRFGLLNRGGAAYSTVTQGFACLFYLNDNASLQRHIGIRDLSEGTSLNENVIINQYDLTQMFQAGNEPTTIEEFNARVATLGIDMYAHNEGEVIHCNTESIKSVGDNAWDEEWESGRFNTNTGEPNPASGIRTKNPIKVLPNQSYWCLANNNIFALFWDSEGNLIEKVYYENNYLPIKDKQFTTPANADYMVFYVPDIIAYNHDIMITLVHSGWKQDTDAGYQPYWQDTLPLPIIRKYFPDGMKSAGSAHDEIRFNKASGKWEYSKGRIKSVDLGTLGWLYNSTSGQERFFTIGIKDVVAQAQDSSKANLVTSRYITDSFGSLFSHISDKLIAQHSSGQVVVYDSAYTDVASFKAAMQGVILYYESNDWEWVELDAEDQNFRDYYQVADFGTEQSQSSVPSAAFSADIIYQFNAVDMIREHELEITELQKVIATMQAQLTSLINGGQ